MSQLAKVGSAEEQAACRDRLEQLEPPIRYCTYQLERAGGAAPGGAPEPSSPASARLQVRPVSRVDSYVVPWAGFSTNPILLCDLEEGRSLFTS